MNPNDEDIVWLKLLEVDIWRRVPKTPNSYGFSDEARRLTDEEWYEVKQILGRNPQLICSAHNACMGFGIGMAIFEPKDILASKAWLVSDSPRNHARDVKDSPKPKYVIDITKNHLPLSCAQGELKDRTSFEDGWVAFSPFTHSDRNRELLKANGLEEPKSKGHYDY